MTTRDDCLALDAGDPLADLRQLFALPDGVIYLDGNSLGARPRAAVERAAEVVAAEWGRGPHPQLEQRRLARPAERLGDKLAPLIGARAGEVVITDTTSINLFKVLSAALRIQEEEAPGRKVIVSESSNFPTDLYIAEGLTDMLQRGYRLRLVDGPEQLPAADRRGYRGGDAQPCQLQDRLPARHARGHPPGPRKRRPGDLGPGPLGRALPLDLHAAEADYAIGCTYKYLNGGPGSPAYVWVAPRLRERVWQPLSGWFGHSRQFAMEPRYQPGEGITRFLCGTQPITSLALVECGLDIFARTDMQRLRDKSLALADLFIELVESRCERFGLTLVTPREHARRGSHVSFEHAQGYAIVQALIDRGVIGDYREPGILRFGFTPLYTRFVEVWDAVQALLEILQSEAWKEPRYQVRHKVT
ncbi:kynureninase [Pseudomonas aeruginosa]|nr:kynureninase [Pseudomonas aeruginosa]